jgi:hypothetical protein
MDAHFSKSHVLAGVQDAYWSDEEGVCRSLFYPGHSLILNNDFRKTTSVRYAWRSLISLTWVLNRVVAVTRSVSDLCRE